MSIVAIGNPVFDIIETPFIKTNGRVLSGCSTNAALTYAKLGGKAILIGKVGDDFKLKLIETTKKYGVEVIALKSRNSGGFYLKYLDEKMEDRELYVLGVADPINFNELPSFAFESQGIIIGPILNEISHEFMVNLANNHNDGLILVDPQGFLRKLNGEKVVHFRPDYITDIIRLSHVFKPNEKEAKIIFPSLSPEKIALKISNINNAVGIVTLAHKGSVVAFMNKVYHIPAFRTVERDPTGCGDVYAGAFMYYYLRTDNPIEAAAFASAAASFMVETTGPDFKLPFRELEHRFEKILNDIKRLD